MISSKPSRPRHQGLWTPARLALSFLTLSLIALFGVQGCNQPSSVIKPSEGASNTANANKSATTNTAATGRPMPLDAAVLNMELKALDGQSFKLADYAGKVVIVNVWATWCGPCRVEIPELISLYNEFKARDVELIGVTNEDPVEDAALVKNFVKDQKINYRIAWGSRDFVMGLMQGDVRNAIPQSFIITRDGQVFKRFVGFNPSVTPPKLREALEQAINYRK
jgi:thiol-disulfide isomerase/thioredoxin